MYAIRHKITHKWVYGTDYRFSHKHKDGHRSYSQLTSDHKALIFEYIPNANFEFEVRGVSKRYYEIVKVEIVVIGPMAFYADNQPYYTSLEPTEVLMAKENP